MSGDMAEACFSSRAGSAERRFESRRPIFNLSMVKLF
jgi:hypothetical protein